MKTDVNVSNLALSGAVLTFLATAGMAVSSVVTVEAVNCYYDGYNGIGSNCIEEWQGGWLNCYGCAEHYCDALGAGGGVEDECDYTCRDGAWDRGCMS